jgi:hypothetical protein
MHARTHARTCHLRRLESSTALRAFSKPIARSYRRSYLVRARHDIAHAHIAHATASVRACPCRPCRAHRARRARVCRSAPPRVPSRPPICSAVCVIVIAYARRQRSALTSHALSSLVPGHVLMNDEKYVHTNTLRSALASNCRANRPVMALSQSVAFSTHTTSRLDALHSSSSFASSSGLPVRAGVSITVIFQQALYSSVTCNAPSPLTSRRISSL